MCNVRMYVCKYAHVCAFLSGGAVSIWFLPSPQRAPMLLVSIRLVIRGPVLMAATPGEGLAHCWWSAVSVGVVTHTFLAIAQYLF